MAVWLADGRQWRRFVMPLGESVLSGELLVTHNTHKMFKRLRRVGLRRAKLEKNGYVRVSCVE